MDARDKPAHHELRECIPLSGTIGLTDDAGNDRWSRRVARGGAVMTPSCTSKELGRFIAGTQYDDLPGHVVAKAKRHILDTLGAALAGATSQEARRARAVLM